MLDAGSGSGPTSSPQTTSMPRNRLITSHLDRLEDALRATQTAVRSLRDLLGSSTPASIGLRGVAATLAVAITAVVDTAELGPWFRGAFGELDATLAASGVRPAGPVERLAIYPGGVGVGGVDKTQSSTLGRVAWPDNSIMARRGLAGGQVGTTHALTEERQGTFHFTMGPYSTPVLEIQPGDRVTVETRDAFGGVIHTESDLPSATLTMPFVNPQNGPIMVAGAEKGDALAVHIESMAPRGDNPRGTCAMIPEFGALTGTSLTATLNQPLPERVRKVPLDAEHVYWSDRVTLPYRPHIGTLSTSPELDSINSLTPDNHGGNMDLPDMGPGSITYLPVRTLGARLFIGDAHACQGDGEVCGTAVEYASLTTIHVELIKGWTIEWPRLENEDLIMAIGSARPLEDAARIAYRELIYWMERDYGFDRWDAYMMLSQCGHVRLGNFVDPKYTVGAAIRKTYLEGV